MAMRHPEVYAKVARDIAVSWRGMGGNFVLVAPPLTDPDYVFKLLCDVSFQEDCDLDPEKLAIASLPPASYRTSEEFVQRVLELWDIDVLDEEDMNGELELLENALDDLEEQNRIPIILLPQFHKTIERLSWTLGARLRELEVNYGLCTVVELPVPLSQLRDRWEVLDGKETFICSDFGQGHSMILLTGYQRNEVEALTKEAGLSQEHFEKIWLWSGGMPALVKWLTLEALRAKSMNDLEVSARRGSVEQCRRFLKWLDAPDSDFFKHLLSALWQKRASEEERTAVREHDWKDVLIDRNDCVFSTAIGFACTNSIGGDYKQSLASIASAVVKGSAVEVDALVSGLSEGCRTEERIKLIIVTIPVWRLAIGFSPDWKGIEKASKQAENQLGHAQSASAKTVISALRRWHNFSKEVCNFNRLVDKNSEQNWRLTDSLSGRGKSSTQAAVQLVLHRLYEAKKIQDSNAALKSVLEIPEQILQIYCGRKLEIPVWEAPEFQEEDIDAVRKLWKEGEYRVPQKGSRLGFVDLLYLGWVQMAGLEEKQRLFHDFSDIKYWRETYEDMRNQPSHSITFESDKRWQDFYSNCLALADQLAISLTRKTSEEVLPKLTDIIVSTANGEIQIPKE